MNENLLHNPAAILPFLIDHLWWLLGLIALLLLLRYFRAKADVTSALATQLLLDRKQYQSFKSICLPGEDGPREIDQLIVSRFGLFMIESNRMQGLIEGNEHMPTWLGVKGGSKQKFPNPLQQAQQHANLLQARLHLEAGQVIPVVCFSGNVEFRSLLPANVCKGLGHIAFIKSHKDVQLSREQCLELRHKLNAWSDVDNAINEETNADHNSDTAQPPKSCPKCGNGIVLRTAPQAHGASISFWGCAAFPRCNFSMNRRQH